MSASTITIRPPETTAEADLLFHLSAETLHPAFTGAQQRRFVENAPKTDPIHVRCAVRDKTYLGSYLMFERSLSLGRTTVRAGCIGDVFTHPDHRHQGVARALLSDAVAYAREQRYGFLLLYGIPDFYERFGLVDIFDSTEHSMERASILDQASSSYLVRYATLDDAAALLALYQRHYGGYTGSFARVLEHQQHLLRHRYAEHHVLLTSNADEQPCGYAILSPGPDRSRVVEAGADDGSAALALLHYHACLLDDVPNPPSDLSWSLPDSSPTYYLLADHFAVRSQTYRQPNAGWMALPIDVRQLLQALLPRWCDQVAHADWPGSLALAIDGESYTIEASPGGLSLNAHASDPVYAVSLSRQVFARLVFGYRPLTWATRQPDQSVPEHLVPLLNKLFPLGHTWIAASDGF